MKSRLYIFIFASIFIKSATAENTITLKTFLDLAKTDDSFLMQIMATGEAFGWANSDLLSKKQKPLFCSPDKFTFMPNNYLNILQKEALKRSKILENDYRIYPLLLLEGLKETFPCN